MRTALKLAEDAQLLVGSGTGAEALGRVKLANALHRRQAGDGPWRRSPECQMQLACDGFSGTVTNTVGLSVWS